MFEDSEQLPSITSSPRDCSATSDDSILDLSVVRTLKPSSNRDILGMILKNLKVSKIILEYFQNTCSVLCLLGHNIYILVQNNKGLTVSKGSPHA